MATVLSTTSTVRAAALADFASRLRGELTVPGDAGYDAARRVWNAAGQKRPALVARAADALDVIRAVNFARTNDLALAIKSGGHSMAGHSSIEDGMLLDLSGMKGMHVDPQRRVARVQPGRTWGEYAAVSQQYGLATSSGDMPSVGVAGLALGGGIGWMVRKHGLTVDHLVSVDVVTADGRLVTASEREHPDLFWGLRGGGGNFGIATSLELRLQEAGLVLGGAVIYPAAQAKEVLAGYVAHASAAPDELTSMAVIMKAPPLPFIPAERHGETVVIIMVCYSGDLEAGQRAVAPLRALGEPIADITGPMPYPAMFELTKEGAVKGLRHTVRSMYLPSLDGAILNTLVGQMEQMDTPAAMLQLRVLGGAMARVPADATAFAHRAQPLMLTMMHFTADPEESERDGRWVYRSYEALRPYASGVYANFLTDEGEARIRQAYPAATYARLAALKREYDPTNFFRLNQNIKPAR